MLCSMLDVCGPVLPTYSIDWLTSLADHLQSTLDYLSVRSCLRSTIHPRPGPWLTVEEMTVQFRDADGDYKPRLIQFASDLTRQDMIPPLLDKRREISLRYVVVFFWEERDDRGFDYDYNSCCLFSVIMIEILRNPRRGRFKKSSKYSKVPTPRKLPSFQLFTRIHLEFLFV